MKKFTFFVFLLLIQVFVFAQNVERENVVLEIGTGTWCVYCPGAAGSADLLVEEGKDLAVIENHNQDQFTNVYSNARNSYYGIGAFPTAKFDGIITHEGGQACPPPFNNVYAVYLQKYNDRKPVTSPYSISWTGYNTSGNNYTVTIVIDKVGTVATDNSYVHFVVTESHLSATWFCMTECNFVNRLMVPDQSGTPLSLSGTHQEITLQFTLDPSWDTDEIELVCFIQRNTNKEIHQAIQSTLSELPPPPPLANFTADNTMVCETNTVHFTDQSTGNITSRVWTFPGGTPGSSTQENPTVIYNTSGTYNVTLKVYSGSQSNELTKPAYISVSAMAPTQPGVPLGENQLCKNPPNQTYTTAGSSGAVTYDWELNPSTAGLIMNDGNQTITVNWVNAYTGDATLTVKAINGCGESDFSEPLDITVSPRPEIFNITGGGEFCEGEPGVEIGLDNSATGVSYELYKDNEPTGNIVSGAGGPISFGLIAEPGSYKAVAFDPVTLCDNTMASTATVTTLPKPVAYAITGGGSYCEGTPGIEVGLESSQQNCSYELFCNDVSTGIFVTGTGDPISFGLCSTLGFYHAAATDLQTTCANMMTGTTEVTLAPLPEVPLSPVGPVYVDLYYTNETEYETTGSAFSNFYNWNLDPSDAGEVETFDISHCRVIWNMNFLGQVEIRTEGVNDCGESSWSEPIVVTINNTVGFNTLSDHFGIKISPNPSDGIFTILMKSAKEEFISLKVVSAINAVAYEENNIAVNGSLTKTIDLSHAPDGVYFLYIETNESTYLRKLVFH